jgi:dipeptidyl-peptidase 4
MMRISRNFLSFVFLFLVSAVVAQNKLLTMEEALIKQRTSLAPANLKQLKWIPGADKYAYLQVHDGKEVLFVGDATGKKKEVLSIDDLNAFMISAGLKKVASFPELNWKRESLCSFVTDKKKWWMDLTAKTIKSTENFSLPTNAENIDRNETSEYVAYTVKNNLFVQTASELRTVTSDKNVDIVNGKSVHREEFGIYKGTFWSPNGKSLAFYRMDQTMVADYPIIDWKPRPAKNNNIKYPMAGDSSHHVNIGIYNVEKGTTVFLKTGTPLDQYLTNVCWSPDEKYIYVAIVSRDQQTMNYNCYDATTGSFVKTLFTEKESKYVQPMHPAVFVPNHPDRFVWFSERDGYTHLYLYSTSGELIRQLTSGPWVVLDIIGFDAKGEEIYYLGNAESPVNKNVYVVSLSNGKGRRVTPGKGVHTAQVSTSGKYLLDNFQSTTTPREITLYATTGKAIQSLLKASNPLQDYALGALSLFTIKSNSGEDLYCRMYKPVQFDSTKKYPVIVYQYAGPNVQLITDTWNGGGDLWFQYMAERGFIVFTVDNRGTENRGKAFEQSTYLNLGAVEMEDQMAGVAYLKRLPYVDANRMGLFGWSYGGFMTCSIMTHYPDAFKAAVAGGPVIDWSYYEIMYTERYMSTPKKNPEGYERTNVINGLDRLKGHLLVIHGTDDPVVVWQHSLQLLKASVDKGKQLDYFVYPGHEHNIIGKDRPHLYQKVTDYFILHL